MPGVAQQRPRAGMFAGKSQRPAAQGFWSRLGNQVRAAGEGALDAATFGLDDQVAAGIRAAGDWTHGKSIGAAYKQRIAEQHARDAYDAAHYGVARTVGTVGSLFLPGGGIGAAARFLGKAPQMARLGTKAVQALGKAGAPAAKVARRIEQVTRLSGKERAAIGASGAVGGVAGQGVTDLLQGRLSSWGDYAGAAAGGTAEALAALRGNPKLAGAVGGATTSVAQDAFNGHVPSLSEVAKSAYAGSVLSAAAGALATRRAAQATIKQKEQLGELGSRIRTLMNLDWTTSTKKERFYLNPENQIIKNGKRVKNPHTYPDQRTARDKLIEAKFGEWAELSPRQMQAYNELGSRYRVDHFLPNDVGSVAGFLVSQPTHAATHLKYWDFDPSAVSTPPAFGSGLPPFLGKP